MSKWNPTKKQRWTQSGALCDTDIP
jgi:hypothetical protein